MISISPRARLAGLSMEVSFGDLVIHDAINGQFHTLNPTAAAIWQLCDGLRTPSVIEETTGYEPQIVALALDELSVAGLLEEPLVLSGLTRREVARRLAAAGVTVAILPAVGSITGTNALAAGSGCAQASECPPTGSFSNCRFSTCVDGVCGIGQLAPGDACFWQSGGSPVSGVCLADGTCCTAYFGGRCLCPEGDLLDRVGACCDQFFFGSNFLCT